jgi:ElaB/YqjD/DUF883 family membrane-anchored ribosome-binding protein
MLGGMKTTDLTTRGEELTHRFRDLQQSLGEKAKDLSKKTDEYVHDNPWRTVGIAALVGCIIGFILRRD